jgi:hypothetical protein
MPEPLARFSGAVSCQRTAGTLTLTLSGTAHGSPAQPMTVAFAAPVPPSLPPVLPDARVEQTAPGQFRIASAAGEWYIAAAAAHVHRDVSAQFYRAVPPRAVPLGKRVFWNLVLILAGSRGGLALLRWLRRAT